MDFKDRCLAYLEGDLSESEQASFESEVNESQEKQVLLDRYRELLALEQVLSNEQGTPGSHFTVKVMEAVGKEGSHSKGFIERYFEMSNKFLVPVAGLAVVTICIALVVNQDSKNIEAFQAISPGSFTGQSEGLESEQRSNPSLPTRPVEEASREKTGLPDKSPADDALADGAVNYDTEQREALSGIQEAPKQEWTEAEAEPQSAQSPTQGSSSAVYKGRKNDSDKSSFDEGGATVEYSDKKLARKPQEAPIAEWEMANRNIDIADLAGRTLGESKDGSAPRTFGAKKKASAPATDNLRSRVQQESGRAASAPLGASRSGRDADANYPVSDPARRLSDSAGQVGSKYMRVESGKAPTLRKEQWSTLQGNRGEAKRRVREEEAAGMVVVPEPQVIVPQPPQSNERYAEYRENPRVRVSEEPRSTFSLDVDTGSYTNMRRFLTMGKFPPANAVRVEEFINYFSYQYPSQVERPFAVHYEIAPSPFASGRHLLKVGVKARDNSQAEINTPWNLVFLIDVSGSMSSSNKLPLLKQSMSVLVNKMRSEDRIAIVTYATGARVLLPSTAGTQKQRIISAIQSLRAGGSTNGSAGIDLAYAQAERFKQDYSVNRVVLATDGDFNLGTTSFSGLMRLIEQKRRTGIGLTSLGFGKGNLNEKNLEQLADKGNGNYFYIDSFAEARKVLGDQLASTMEVVAKDVKLQIEFNPAQVLEYRLIGYDNRVLENRDFSNDAVDAGEVGSGHTVTAMYEIVLRNSPIAGDIAPELRYMKQKNQPVVPEEFSDELAFVKIRYKEPQGTKSAKMQFPIETVQLKTSFESASVDFRFATAVAAFAQALRGSQFAGDYSYQDVIRIAIDSLGDDSDGLRRQFVDLVRNAQAARPQR